MWTRALLKDNAKTVLRRSYWRVFLACLIVSLLCGGDFNLNYRFGADSFTRGYWNTVGVMFFMNLKVFLWTLLLIVPGIVKSYQYRFIPFLLAENPDLPADRAFEISTMMTDGEKWNIFVLDLSFLGWNLLGLLLLGIGALFVDPYVKATEAELYAALRAKVLASGYVTEEELTGQS